MQKALDWLTGEFAGLQVGRATKGLVDNISVEASYGAMPVGQLANITLPDAQTIRIEPWDKSVMAAMEKGIYDAGTGLTPQNNGDYLLVKIPPLTGERRKEIVKQVSALGEDAKSRMRKVRQDLRDGVKKEFEAKEVSEDERKQYEQEVEDLTKDFTGQVDQAVKTKESEILNG